MQRVEKTDIILILLFFSNLFPFLVAGRRPSIPFGIGPIEKLNSQWIYRHDPLYEYCTLVFSVSAATVSGNFTDIIINRVYSHPLKVIRWGVYGELKRIVQTWVGD